MRTAGRSRSVSRTLAVATVVPTTAALVLALSALAVLAVSVTSAGAATQGRCAAASADRWTRIPPANARVVATGVDDLDPCQLVQSDGHSVFLSSDGGKHWSTGELAPHGPITTVITEGLGPNAVLLGTKVDPANQGTGSLLLSTDAGRTFAAVAPGLEGMRPLSVAVAPGVAITESDAATVFLLAAPDTSSPGPDGGSGDSHAVLFVSNDSAQTFSPLPTGAAASADRVVVDPTDPAVLWLNGQGTGAAAALWRSVDGGQSFSQVDVGTTGVNDIALSLRPDGVVLVYVATDQGVLVSDTDGLRWRRLRGQTARATSVRVSAADFNGVVAVVGGRPARGREPQAMRLLTTGLPAGCDAGALAATPVHPTLFTTMCGHGTYVIAPFTQVAPVPVLPGDAGDPVGPSGRKPNPGPPGASNPQSAVAVPMTAVQTWMLPGAVTAAGYLGEQAYTTGSLAFDGRVLYYLLEADSGHEADNNGILRIGRIDARTGAALPVLSVRLGLNTRTGRTTLDFDAPHNRLLINTARGLDESKGQYARLVSYDLRSGRIAVLFDVPRAENGSTGAPWVKYDAANDNFILVEEGGLTLSHLDKHGRRIDTCSFYDSVAQMATTSASAGGDMSAAAAAAAGDGGAYVQLEDDATVLRLAADCRLVQTYSHRKFSESFGEDDDIACDSQTFSLPALWIRDAEVATVTAFAAPAYCPLSSGLTIAAPAVVSTGDTALVCAILRLRQLPVAAQRVSLNVGGQELAVGPTDATGRTCAPYRAGGAGRVAVVARYFGARNPRRTPQYLPAEALGSLEVTALPVALPIAGLAALAPPAPAPGQPPPAARPAVEPGSQVQAQPQVQPQPQGQQQAQQQSQGQSQAQLNGQFGLAGERQQQAQLAYATTYADETEYAMSALPADDSTNVVLIGAACLAAATAMGSVALARQTKRVGQRW
jgi:hypothetical protein